METWMAMALSGGVGFLVGGLYVVAVSWGLDGTGKRIG